MPNITITPTQLDDATRRASAELRVAGDGRAPTTHRPSGVSTVQRHLEGCPFPLRFDGVIGLPGGFEGGPTDYRAGRTAKRAVEVGRSHTARLETGPTVGDGARDVP